MGYGFTVVGKQTSFRHASSQVDRFDALRCSGMEIHRGGEGLK